MPRLAGEAGSAAGPGRAGAGAGSQHRAMESRDELDMAARDPLIGDYLDLVRAANPDGGLRNYPGSPWLAVRLARADDRVVACETVPEVAAALAAAVPAAERHRRDGYEAHALLPPKERRGLVLVDPPFERADEFEALAAFVNRARARFAGGVYAIWYPLKNRHAAARFVRRTAAGGRALELRLDVGAGAPGRLHACAVLVINPPFGFTEQAEAALRALLPVLRRGAGAGFAVRPVAAA
ncbi:MAG: 23S rRNA (adenine(2030)-N(6))-methyltransferase RlmJ [Gammaproteobacteria bacterium]|nr:23S rRNA (adenine(2030)-N(6))-methyltransferase RlmJ [Gammaproteobacteria bacterium]